MVTAILGLVSGLIGLISKVMGWLAQKQLIDAGKAEATSAALEVQKEASHEALNAREEVRANWVASAAPNSVPNDGFSRD